MDREVVTLTLPPGGTEQLMEILNESFDFQFSEVPVGDDVATLGDISEIKRRRLWKHIQ